MNRLRYMVLILLLLATGRLAGQEPVIDEVCRGASYHYRVDGEVGSTYTWTLTHPDGVIDQLYSTADTILIHWDYPAGIYRLEVMQFNEDFDCDAYPMDGFIIINDLPLVSLDPFDDLCLDAGPLTLTGGLPEGGIYAGTGITAGVFDPALAGPGTHSITYTFTDSNGCVNFAEASIHINDLPLVSLDPFDDICLDAGPLTLAGGLPAGGTYTGTGITIGVFDPALAGSGTHPITYTFTDSNGCVNFATATITVHDMPIVSISDFGDFCISVAPFALSGGEPEGGIYAGPGVSNGTFDPALAGSGTHTITYTFTDANGCTGTSSASITVFDLPLVSLDVFDSLCLDAEPFALSGGLPEGGTYAGAGISEGIFNPALAGSGTHTITYTFTDGNGCGNFATALITVHELPIVSLESFDDLCIDTTPLALIGGLPEGGIYTGTGVSEGTFDPAAAGTGDHLITYTYTDANGCTNFATTTITVHELPVVSLSAFDALCLDAAPLTLTGGLPEGGIYTGTGISEGTFNPAAAGSGDHLITYTYTDINGCTNFATTTITVNELPVVSLAAFDELCLDAAPLELTGGLPEGGIYTGTGVSGDTFDPAVAGSGTHTITYTYTDGNGCTNFTSATIRVYEPPIVSLNDFDNICLDAAPFELTGGLPEGGTYSGTGLTGNTFSPATAGTGDHLITYTYTDGNGCNSFATITLTVNDMPLATISPFDNICLDAGLLELSGGLPAGGTYSGPGVDANAFDPMVAGLGSHEITYTYTDANGCTAFATANIEVNDLPVVTLSHIEGMCADASAFALTGGLPEGGIYSGPGIIGGIFDPAIAGSGVHTYTYTFTDASGCAATAIATIGVEETPVLTLDDIEDVCIDAAPFVLIGGQPEGGTYSGVGITAGVFDPMTAGLGAHQFTYTYTDSHGCTAIGTAFIHVVNTPTVLLTLEGDVCDDTPAYELSGGLPLGGTYSGDGVVDGIFDPELAGTGEHIITYTYTDVSGCTGFATAPISVNPLTPATLAPFADTCLDTAPFALTGGLPTGGVYTGAGITDNIFDAAAAGAGDHLVTYTYTDVFGCTAFDTATIRVMELPVVTLEPIDNVCSDGAPFALTGGLPSGGTYSGAGVTAGVFDPGTAGPGDHLIIYTYSDANACTAFATVTLSVIDIPVVSLTLDGDVCRDTAPYALSGGLPLGGTYSGDGVSGGIFDPEIAGPGEHIITYTYSDANGCTAFATATITVNPVDPATLEPFANICIDIAPFVLTGGLPTGGIYTGTGINGNIFDPSAAGAGDHIITYTYADAFGCTAFATAAITVMPLPTVSLGDLGDICIDAAPFALTGGLPTGGTYSGTGVTAGIFNPEDAGTGSHLITYTYTNANGCTAIATTEIQVVDVPDVTLAGISDMCIDAIPFTLTGGLPAGGTYTGNGVTGLTFDPAIAGPGEHIITYTLVSTIGCEGFAVASVTVFELPAVSFAFTEDVCANAPAFALSGGLPAGGTYSGTGVTANTFDPAVAGPGDHLITYTYSDMNGCNGMATANIHVNELPVVTLADLSDVCIDNAPFVLGGGLPVGGVYSGPGVTADTFDPGAAGNGTHLITYTYTDAQGCAAFATTEINVANAPNVTLAGMDNVCIDAMPFALTSGLPAGGTYSGTGINANTFDPVAAGLGEHEVTYTYTDASGCSGFATATIRVVNAPVVTLNNPGSICDNEAPFALTGGLPAGGTYSGNGVANGTFDPVAAGPGDHLITYIYTDANGCFGEATATITVQPAPVASLPEFGTICIDASPFELHGGLPAGGTYSGEGVTTTGLFEPYMAGEGLHTIIYTLADANGCTAVATSEIVVVPMPMVVCADDIEVAEEDGPITLSGGQPVGGIYSGTGVTNGIFNPAIAGVGTHTITYTFTDGTGCTSFCTFTITVTKPIPDLEAFAQVDNQVSCFGVADGQATAWATGGALPYTYLWNDPAAQTTAQATNLAPGTYIVVITDVEGRTDQATITITQPFELSLVVTGTNPATLGGNDGYATATPGGGTIPYTYLWNDSNSQTTATATGLVAGTYTVIVTDDKGCSITDQVTLRDPLGGTAIVLNHVLCADESNGHAEAMPEGGVAPYTYLWSNGQTTKIAANLAAGTYWVTISDSLDITSVASVTILQPSILRIDNVLVTQPSTPGSADGWAQAFVSGGTPPYTYSWSGPVNTSGIIADNLVEGEYTLRVTDANGCEESRTVTLTDPILPLEITAVVVQHVSCFGGNDAIAEAMVTGGKRPYTYRWTPTNQTTARATGLSAGDFTVRVTDARGLYKETSVTINQPFDITLAPRGVDPSIPGYSDGFAEVTATGGAPPYSYRWNDPAGQQTARATGLGAGLYQVTVTDELGCTKTISIELFEPVAVLLISKIARETTVEPDGTITYDIILFNQGPADAFNIQVVDVLSDSLIFVSASPEGEYNADNNTVTWNLPYLYVSRSFTLQAQPKANYPGGSVITNIVRVFSPFNKEPIEAQAVVRVRNKPDMALHKEADRDTYSAVGELVDYTIRVENTGNVPLSNIVVSDPNAIITSGSPIASLPMGASALVTAQYAVKQIDLNIGFYENVASATALDADGNTFSRNSNMAIVYAIQSPALEIIKSAVEPSFAAVGDEINYTFTVVNTGNVHLFDITVEDPDIDFYLGNHIDTINPGESVSITGRYYVTQADLDNGQKVNIASVLARAPQQNTAEAISNEVVVPAVFNTIVANDDENDIPASGYFGGIGFDNVLINDVINGVPVTRSQVILRQIPPLSPVNITLNELTGEVNVMPQTPGGTYTITYEICEVLNIRNCDQAIVTIHVGNTADLAITKETLTADIWPGGDVSYAITVTNLGPEAAEQIVVSDPLDTAFVSSVYSTDNGQSWQEWPGEYHYTNNGGVLRPAESFKLTIRALLTEDICGSVSNEASVMAYTFDQDLTNNSSTVQDAIISLADLSITKTASRDHALAGEPIEYTLEIFNHGPCAAEGVVIEDAITGNLIHAEFSIDGGLSWADWAGSFDYHAAIGHLPANSAFTLVIRGMVNPAFIGKLVNTASIRAATMDPDLSNNQSSASTTIEAMADLAIQKSANPQIAIAGNEIIYSLEVTNHGPSNSQGVNIVDVLDDLHTGAQFSTDLGNTWNTWEGSFDLMGANSTLPANETIILLIRASIEPCFIGVIDNTASVSARTEDPEPANNVATIHTPVIALADLEIIKTANPDPAVAGQLLTYTLQVINHGPSCAADPEVTDVIDSQLSDVVFSTDMGESWEPWDNMFKRHNEMILSPGAYYSILVRGKLDPNAVGNLSNTALVNSTTEDPDYDNNTATILTPIISVADLGISMTDNVSGSVYAGEQINYTITTINLGPSTAINPVVTSILPPEVRFIAADNNGIYNATDHSVSWRVNRMAVGRTIQFDLRVRIESSTPDLSTAYNTASIWSDSHDPNHANNTTTIGTRINTKANLAIEKTVLQNHAVAGEPITYSIAITNAGPSDATHVIITDIVDDLIGNTEYSTDAGITWQAWTGSYQLPGINGILVNGDSFTLLIRGHLSSAAFEPIHNTATVETGTRDPDLSNNTSTTITPVETVADLDIRKAIVSEAVVAGKEIMYSLIIRNSGPSDARGVVVLDPLNSALLDASFSLDMGQTWNTWTGSFDYQAALGSFILNHELTILIQATIDPGFEGTLENTARVEAATFDPDLTNNTASTSAEVILQADLILSKTAIPEIAYGGDTVVYDITITNAGPSDAVGMTITDQVDEKLLNQEYSIDNGQSWAVWEGHFRNPLFDRLQLDSSFTLLIRAATEPCFVGIITNTASVSASTFDPNPDNNTATIVTTFEALADLQITKTATPSPATAGEAITYTITATNLGPSCAIDPVITDVIDSRITDAEYSTDGGNSWQPWNGQYPELSGIHIMYPGDAITILITGHLSPEVTEQITNTAHISSMTPDPNYNNNTVTLTTPVLSIADLYIDITDNLNGDVVYAGSPLHYTTTVTNHGPSYATQVVIVNALPAEVTFVEATENGTYNAAEHAVYWHLDPMEVGRTQTFNLTVLINSDTPEQFILVNTATVSSNTYDPVPGNNQAVVHTAVSTLADLAIVYKSIIPTRSPTAGTQIAYTITVTNHGPSDAIQGSVFTELPQDLNYVRSSRGNTITNKSITWPIGDLAAGDEIEITLIVNVPSHIFENTLIESEVEVQSLTSDPVMENNIDSAEIDIRAEADLSIIKTIDGDIAAAVGGDQLSYTISVTNNGPSFAYDLRIVDELPEGLTFISADDNGYYDIYYRTVTWSLPFLADGQTVTRKVTVRLERNLTDGTILTNNAYTVSATHDPITNNNFWSVDVRALAPLGLFIPEGFSPDGDGINDLFVIGGLEDLSPVNKMLILDRWGKKVHETANYQNDWWDGTDLECVPLPIGTYYYILELGSTNEKISGFIYLMRPY